MRIPEIIRTKRDGGELTVPEMKEIIGGCVSGSIPDYQLSALLMAVLFRGMSGTELSEWTRLMAGSGKILDLSDIPGVKVDKHSTGGVGDKCTLICAPIAAACGVPVPMICGRGLGHTGGTIDKLESIPGFRTSLDETEFKSLLKRNCLAITAQTADMAPADSRLYALRDVTGTVESIPLIASSIMSKKFAGGADAIVFDVKFGRGAFMRTMDKARELAVTLGSVCAGLGKTAVALITGMNQPLGSCVGNALEVAESIAILKGEKDNDCARLSFELAARMLTTGRVATGIEEARRKVADCVASGAAISKFNEMVSSQGGPDSLGSDLSILPSAPAKRSIHAETGGFVEEIDAGRIGLAAIALGAGRERLGSDIDLAAGIVFDRKVGDPVRTGDNICTLHYDPERTGGVPEAVERSVIDAIKIGPVRILPGPLVTEVIL
jgi:pyrimidine-nucleoside phosphorylase